MGASLRLVAGLLWGSGFCALFYQTAWQRMFRLVFGASTAASAAVLAVFLGGLGAGGLVLGARAERHERPLYFYGNLELGVAFGAAVSPFLATLLGKAYLALGGVATLGQPLATLVRLLITTIVIGPAAFFMGGTLPAAARAVESEGDRARARLALLYGTNTLGAVAGALLGTFVLFEFFGIRLSLLVAVLVNVLVGLAARSAGRDAKVGGEVLSSTNADSTLAATVLAYLAAGLVGFAFLLLEIVWYRLLAPILGGSTYTFGLVLAVALTGIGLGGYLYSRRDPERAVTASSLALVTALEGLCVALPIALGDRIALYAILTRHMSSLGFGALVLTWASITAVVVFPAALVSGYQFPLLFALLGSGRERVARHVGAAYAFNTAGALLGSLLGGFVLVPRLTAVGSYRLVAATLLALALVALGFEAARSVARALRGAAVVVPLVVLGAVFATRRGPTAVFRHLPIGAGRVDPPGRTVNQWRAFTAAQNESVLWEADGVETSVAMTTGDQLAFIVDGKSDGAVYTDRATQACAGLLAALFHPAPKRSLVIGLGTGMTAGFLSVVPGMETVDVAELEPSILEVARIAARANYDVLHRPNVHVHLGDGRELVLSAKGRYDVIASEPSNPYRAGVASLYTVEFYKAVAAHLAEHGIFLQWIQGYEIDVGTVETVAHTLGSVLPSVQAWETEAGDIVFIASRSHRRLDAAELRARIQTEPYRFALLHTLLVQDLEGLLGRFLASDALVSKLGAEPGVELNTDDQNLIEYAFARGVGSARDGVAQSLLAYSAKLGQDRPDVIGAVDWERVAELRSRAWLVSGETPPLLPMSTAAARARSAAVVTGCHGNAAEALREWASAGAGEPRDAVERYVIGLGLAGRGDDRAVAYADRLASDGLDVEPHLLRGRRALERGDVPLAAAEAFEAVGALRVQPFPLCGVAEQTLLLVGNLAQSHPEYRARAVHELMKPFATHLAEDGRITLLETLAAASGDAKLCVAGLGRHVDSPRWEESFLVERLRCLSAAGRPEAEKAALDLVEYRASTGGSFGPPAF